jgi:hypothetical protein
MNLEEAGQYLDRCIKSGLLVPDTKMQLVMVKKLVQKIWKNDKLDRKN